ncbi:carboxypeptidase-like regulatory domain-containing protein [Salibacter halophilus]|nr:carboxypeptidase-like regulatory domain-containing protein [Salibacter halophilus]
MKRPLAVLLLSLLFSCFNSYSQSTKLSGIVIDKDTRESIPFVHFASTSNQGIGFVSSENGSYKFQFNIDKSDTFSISVIGYKSLKVSVSELVNTDTVYMESKQLELNEFVVSAKPRTAKEIFKDAVKKFNDTEYNDQSFIAGYEELLISNDLKDTSFMKATCVITGYSPKEKVGIFKEFQERVTILAVDSLKNGGDIGGVNLLLMMTRFTKVNEMLSFSFYRWHDYEVTDTILDEDNHVVFKIIGRDRNEHISLSATIDVTTNSFLELTDYWGAGEQRKSIFYRVVFSDYIDVGLPTKMEMQLNRDFGHRPDDKKIYDKGWFIKTTLNLYKKVTAPIETESWVEGSKSMFEGEIDLELKEKMGY